MTYPLPTRSPGESAANHVADHNEIHGILGMGMSTSRTTGTGSGHLADHDKVHRILNTIQGQVLPVGVTTSTAGHRGYHNTIHTLLNAETYGPRGTVGQQASSGIDGFPSSWTVDNIDTYAELSAAVTAGGTGRRFHITGSFALTNTIEPHASDEFWGEDGVTITRSGAFAEAFQPASAVSGVKIMNLAFSGFNNGVNDATIDALSSDSWEIAYCEISNTGVGTKLGASTSGSWVHHCYIHDCSNGFGAFGGRNHIFEDNEYDNCDDLNKFVATQGIIFRHNYSHNCSRSSVWFDTSNTDSLVEWNIIGPGGVLGLTMGGICHESNYWVDGSMSAPDVGTPISSTTKNVIRYNKVFNHTGPGISMYHSAWTEVYGNTSYLDTSADSNTGAIDLEFRNPFKGVGPGGDSHVDLRDNYIHHNYVIQTATNRKAARLNLNIAAGADSYDTAPYISNSKNNNFHHNVYQLASSTHQAFRWATGLATGSNRTFAQWQTIDQGSSGTGTDQDINGERV